MLVCCLYLSHIYTTREVCYGRIHSIIEHGMYPDCPDTLSHVLIECDWYTPTGITTTSGLLQVSFDAELSSTNRWTFLKDMHRANVVLWPAYTHAPTFAQIPRTFFVVEHTVPIPDNMDNSGDKGDEPEDDDEDNE